MLALNSDDYFEYFFAVAWAGGVFVPVNTRLAPPEIAFWLEASGTRVLLVENRFLGTVAQIRGQLGSLEKIVNVGDEPAPESSISYEGLVRVHAPAPDADRTGDDLAGLFYTGGTTGRSKGVMLSHRNLTVNALHIIGPLEWRPDRSSDGSASDSEVNPGEDPPCPARRRRSRSAQRRTPASSPRS